MSGEYYCIEEIDPATYFKGGYDEDDIEASDRKEPVGKDPETKSTTSKKSQDVRLYEIEEELGAAENRCNSLKNQLESMKKLYEKTKTGLSPAASQDSKPFNINSVNSPGKTSSVPPLRCGYRRKIARKRSQSLSRRQKQQNSRSSTPSLVTSMISGLQDSSDTVPHRSSSSSTDIPPLVLAQLQHQQVLKGQQATAVGGGKAAFATPLLRQNSQCIGTDTSGAAVKTITNILAGITSNVNRSAKVKRCDIQRSSRAQSRAYEESAIAAEIAAREISPRVEQRIKEQQMRIQSMAEQDMLPVADSWTNRIMRDSSTTVKSKSAKTISSRLIVAPLKKAKMITGSLRSVRNPIRSIARHAENSTRLSKPTRVVAVDEKNRRRPPRRLKTSTRVLQDAQSLGNKLVELYHNEMAKNSESEDSNHRITTVTKQKGGDGDLASAKVVVPHLRLDADNNKYQRQVLQPHYYQAQHQQHPQQHQQHLQQHQQQHQHNTPLIPKNQTTTSKFTASNRILTPITENVAPTRTPSHQFLHTTVGATARNNYHNYQVDTIASRLKQVAKCYMNAFSFRKIPFCVAKSTSPSHNIGVNIQQVMSIIKTRQPITGISPTLAHNIGLAAGNFDHTLTNLVSTIGSKMTYRQSRCPLEKTSVNYEQLQEMAKTIIEEDIENAEERPSFAGDGNEQKIGTDQQQQQQQQQKLHQEASTLMLENQQIKEKLSEILGQTGGTQLPGNTEDYQQQQPSQQPQQQQQQQPSSVVWTVPSDTQKCTCTPSHKPSGVPFHEVLNRFHMSNDMMTTRTVGSARPPPPLSQQKQVRVQKARTKTWVNSTRPTQPPPLPPAPVRASAAPTAAVSVNPTVATPASLTATVPLLPAIRSSGGDLQGKERNLKTVLKNLYSEFDRMNNTYEALSKNINSQGETDSQLVRQLEEMEVALDKKEEEINMVMSLYTEVLALKDQVKKLREKASQPGVCASGQLKMTDEPTAHLTQLLRQIQNYQLRCKNRA